MMTARIQIRRDATAPGLSKPPSPQALRSDGVDTFLFSSPAQMFTVLTPRRWELIERLQALGPISLRGLGRALLRDVKGLHGDVAILLNVGIVQRDSAGKLHVPYAVIHADFDLKAAA